MEVVVKEAKVAVVVKEAKVAIVVKEAKVMDHLITAVLVFEAGQSLAEKKGKCSMP